MPLPGSRSVERVEDSARGADIELSQADINKIRALSEAAETGERYPASYEERCLVDSLPLEQWKGE